MDAKTESTLSMQLMNLCIQLLGSTMGYPTIHMCDLHAFFILARLLIKRLEQVPPKQDSTLPSLAKVAGISKGEHHKE